MVFLMHIACSRCCDYWGRACYLQADWVISDLPPQQHAANVPAAFEARWVRQPLVVGIGGSSSASADPGAGSSGDPSAGPSGLHR